MCMDDPRRKELRFESEKRRGRTSEEVNKREYEAHVSERAQWSECVCGRRSVQLLSSHSMITDKHDRHHNKSQYRNKTVSTCLLKSYRLAKNRKFFFKKS